MAEFGRRWRKGGGEKEREGEDVLYELFEYRLFFVGNECGHLEVGVEVRS